MNEFWWILHRIEPNHRPWNDLTCCYSDCEFIDNRDLNKKWTDAGCIRTSPLSFNQLILNQPHPLTGKLYELIINIIFGTKSYLNIFNKLTIILQWNNSKVLLFVIHQMAHKKRYRKYGPNWCKCRYCYCLSNCFDNIFHVCKCTIINPLRCRSKPRYHQT